MACDEAAVVCRELEKAGRSIGMAGCLIAGIWLASGSALLTRNIRHFSRVAALEVTEPA